jgi:amidophosphoribosyltransferase
LIAPGLSVEEICRSLGADTLAYISLEGLVASTGISKRRLCCACFDGEYPMETGSPVKAVLEGDAVIEEE